MIGLALVEGIAVVAGIMLAASGLRRTPLPTRARRPRWRRPDLPSLERVALVGVSVIATLLFTRWPVAALAVGASVAFGTSPATRQRADAAEKAEALTVWAEMLRDATGTPRGIEGVLVATAPGAPAMIRSDIQRLARRLPYDPLDAALDDLATDLDDPVGDLVVTALRLAARSGGRQIRGVLDDLASVAREKARMYRRIEVARARPRSDMRAVIVVMIGFVVLFVLMGREYLEPYDTAVGQAVLGLIAFCWAIGIWTMARMSRLRRLERFLARPAESEVAA